MSNRIYIGIKNGRGGVWVAPPGENAAVDNQRMILNSDYPCLRIHAHENFVMRGEWSTSLNIYGFPNQTIMTFPSLPYLPMCDVIAGPSTGNIRISFPPGMDYTDIGNSPYIIYPTRIYSNRIDLLGGYSSFEFMRFYITVYANPIDVEIPNV